MPILGTSVDSIDLAEDRDRFKRLLDKLGLKQPKNGIAYSVEQSRLVAAELGLPLVVRPSYVLGGRAMAIIRDESGARRLSARHAAGPRALRRQGALSQRQDRPDQHGARQEPAAVRPLSVGRRSRSTSTAFATARMSSSAGIMEHIEEAGIHSGDSRLLAAAALAVARNDRRAGRADQEAGAGARCRRPDERAICAEGRRDLCARSQSARLAHRALRRQGDRRADRQDRGAHHGRREAWPASD